MKNAFFAYYCWAILFCVSCGGNSSDSTKELLTANDVPILNQDTTGTSSNITGVVEISHGGTGSSTSQTAINTLVGPAASGLYLRSDGTNTLMSNIQAGDIPTLNQNTTGTSANVSDVVAVVNGGTGSATQQLAINALAGATTSGQYLRGNGTNIEMSGIQAGDIPTLNQNTLGTSINVTGVVAIANGGTGSATQQLAMNALAGTTTAGQYLRGNGTNVSMSGIQAGDIPTLNQNTTGTSANVSGVVAIANGGTGSATQQLAINSLAGATTSGQYLRGNGTNITMSGIQAGDIPTLNQNTTGTSANVSGVVAIVNGGTGSATQQLAINALAGATTSGQYLRGNGTNIAMSGIQAGDVPTLNQNTTGTSANVSGVVAIANGGTGQNSKTNAFDALSPSTTKGDLILHNGTNNLRLPVGSNNQVLAADSAQATGVKWANSSSPDAFSYRQVGPNNDMASAADKVSYYVCGQAATHASNQTGTVFGPVSFTAMPFIQTQAVNVVKMAVVVTVVGSANSKIRFGLYSNKASSTFYPDALLLDCGEVAGDVLGVKEVVVSLALPANSLIWGAVWANDGGGGTRPTMRSIRPDAGQVLNILGWNGDFTNQCTNIAAPLNAYITGTALPATFPTGGNRGVGNIPVVALQFGP